MSCDLQVASIGCFVCVECRATVHSSSRTASSERDRVASFRRHVVGIGELDSSAAQLQDAASRTSAYAKYHGLLSRITKNVVVLQCATACPVVTSSAASNELVSRRGTELPFITIQRNGIHRARVLDEMPAHSEAAANCAKMLWQSISELDAISGSFLVEFSRILVRKHLISNAQRYGLTAPTLSEDQDTAATEPTSDAVSLSPQVVLDISDELPRCVRELVLQNRCSDTEALLVEAAVSRMRASLNEEVLREETEELRSMMLDEEILLSHSSRRRYSPFELRVRRIVTFLRRGYVVSSSIGILLGGIGAVFCGIVLLNAIPSDDELISRFNIGVLFSAIAPAVLALILGCTLVMTNSYQNLQEESWRHRTRIVESLLLLAAIPAIVFVAIYQRRHVDAVTGKTLEEYFSDLAVRSSPSLCAFQHFHSCSGWNSRCNTELYEHWVSAAEDGDDSHLADIINHKRFCASNCTLWPVAGTTVSGEVGLGLTPCKREVEKRVDDFHRSVLALSISVVVLALIQECGTLINVYVWRNVMRRDEEFRSNRHPRQARRPDP